MEVLEEVEGKAIIWCHYQRDVENVFERISKRFDPGSVVHYYGGTLPEERDKALKTLKKIQTVDSLLELQLPVVMELR